MEEKDYDEIEIDNNEELNINNNNIVVNEFDQLIEDLNFSEEELNNIKIDQADNDKYLSLDYDVLYGEDSNPYNVEEGEEKEELKHSYTDKTTVLKAYHNVLYRLKVGNKIVDTICNKLNVGSNTNELDLRTLAQFALMFGDNKSQTNEKTYELDTQDKKNKLFEEETKTVLAFAKYPIVDTENKYKNGDPFFVMQKELVTPYLDKFNNFFFDEYVPILERYNFDVDFSKMTETEIYTLIAGSKLIQDFNALNTEKYLNYFYDKFSSYELEEKFARTSQIGLIASQLIAHELGLYGVNTRKDNVGFNDRLNINYNPEFTKYELIRVNDALKFYSNDNNVLDFDLGNLDNLDIDDDYIDNHYYEVRDLLKEKFSLMFAHSFISNKIYDDNKGAFSSIYIDGKNLYDLAKDKLREDVNNEDIIKEAVKILAKTIRKADKVVEFAQIGQYKTTFTVKPVVLKFRFSNQELNNKYAKTLRKAQSKASLREKQIIARHSKFVTTFEKNHKKIYEDYKYIPLEDRVSKFDNHVLSLINNPETINRTNPYFVELCNRVSGDYNKEKIHYDKLDKKKQKDQDVSSIFTNRHQLKSDLERIYNTFEIGTTLQKYLVRNPDIEKSTQMRRDLQRYFIAFNGLSLDDRMIKTLKFASAINARDGKNKDFTLMRELCDDLIDSFLNTNVNLDFSKENNFIILNSQSNKAFLIGQLLDVDKEYKDILIKRDPAKYYKVNDMRVFYEGITGDVNNDIRLQTGIKPLNDFSESNEYNVYSNGLCSFFDTTLHTKRNYAALNKLTIENIEGKKSEISFDLDVIVYGMRGKNNDLSYTPLSTDINTYINEAIENFENKVIDYSMSGSHDFDNYSKEFASIYCIKDMLFNYSCQMESGDEFVKKILGITTNKILGTVNGFTEYAISQFSINSQNLLELAQEEQAKHPNFKRANVLDFASAILSKALNDPNDVITHTQLKIENNGITPHTAIVKKNYEHMVKRAEKSHNPFRRLLHAIGVSYAEDNVLNTSINRTNNFKNTNSIEEINNHFKEMYQKRIDSVTKELNPVSEDKKNLDKKLDNELNKNNINIMVNDIDEKKEKEIKAEK